MTFDQWWIKMQEALGPNDPRRGSLYRDMCRAAWNFPKKRF
jgi:hypothetical protein